MKCKLAALAGCLLLCLPTGAIADEYPNRAPGLWVVTMPNPMLKTTQKHKECVDPTTDKELLAASKGMSDCNSSFTKQGAEYHGDVSCETNGMKSHSKMVFRGDFKTTYSGDITVELESPQFKMPTQKLTFEAKHMGPCPEDMKPGDVISDPMPGMPQGMRFNVMDAKGKKAE